MNIWLWNHYATTMYKDRAGRHYWFANELKKRGYEVTIFCATTSLNGNTITHIDRGTSKVDDSLDIPFVFVKTSEYKTNGYDRAFNIVNFYKNLFFAARDYAKGYGKPDIIVASSVHPLTLVAGIQIARGLGVPCICEVRDLWPEALFTMGRVQEKAPFGRALEAGEHWIYSNADALIFTKEGDVDHLKEKGWTSAQGGDIPLEKCNYINNGILIDEFDENAIHSILEDQDLDDSETFKVVYAGTVRPVNNVGNLLDAAKIIIRAGGYDDVKILIYGDGIQLPDLRQRVVSEEIANVVLKGRVEKKYVPYVLVRSDLNVLNYSQSLYNWSRGNSSNKLFEYMASGTPVISTVKMGYSIITKYDCGLELPNDTSEDLAEAIMRLHDMSREELERLGKNARRGSMDFDFVKLTDKLEYLINAVYVAANEFRLDLI